MIAFEDIVQEHGSAVLRVCRALVGADDAADAWSETFIAAMRAYPRLRPDSNIRGWLITIAHRKAIDILRENTRKATLARRVGESTASDQHKHTQHSDVNHELRDAVAQLAPKQRKAVIYRYLGDLPYSDIAVLLDCGEEAARRSAADGIARLRTTYRRETYPTERTA